MRLHNMRIFCTLWMIVVVLFSLLWANYAKSDDLPRDQQAIDHGLVRIFAEYDALIPGTSQYLALEVTPEQGWHTYWLNPGDSGLAPEITWHVPPGINVGDMVLPVPRRMKSGDFINYGYESSMTIMVPVTIQQNITDRIAPVSADFRFLLCAEICIPYQLTLGLNLPIRDKAAPVNVDYLAHIREKWPQSWSGPVSWHRDAHDFVLMFKGDVPDIAPEDEGWFYIRQSGVTAHGGKMRITRSGEGLTISVPAGSTKIQEPDIDGILSWDHQGQQHNLLIKAQNPDIGDIINQVKTSPVLSAAAPSIRQPHDTAPGFGLAMILALLGGALLNFMPCVFPVLSIKIMAFMRHHEQRRLLWRENAGYVGGIVICFLILCSVMMVLRQAGAAVGWGFQLQEPLVIWGLMILFLSLGLALGFDLSLASFGFEDKQSDRQPGFIRGFSTGLLVALVASPCTGPLMAAALGAALVFPAWQGALVFVSLGVGMALPMMIVTLVPGFARSLPRPGAWMSRLRQGMAFPMLAAAIWLLWILSGQVDRLLLGWLMVIILLVSFMLWLATVWRKGHSVSLASVLLLAIIGGGMIAGPLSVKSGDAVKWVDFDPAQRDAVLAKGQSVFVDATADWCITCLVNERGVLSTKIVTDVAQQKGIVLMRADWTRRDPVVTRLLEDHKRAGVPLYVMYHPGKAPIVLPQILTETIVLEAFEHHDTNH